MRLSGARCNEVTGVNAKQKDEFGDASASAGDRKEGREEEEGRSTLREQRLNVAKQ